MLCVTLGVGVVLGALSDEVAGEDVLLACHFSLDVFCDLTFSFCGERQRICENLSTVHITRHFFVFARTYGNLLHDISWKVCARHLIHVSCVCVFTLSSTFSPHSSFVSPIFHFIFVNFDFHQFVFHMDVAGIRSLAHFTE